MTVLPYHPIHDKELFDNYVDYIYSGTYSSIFESNGISKLLIGINVDIIKLVLSYILRKKEACIYTGFNWDFTKDNFVKVNDSNKPYALYVILTNKLSKKKAGYTAERDLNKEKLGKTKIGIRLSLLNEPSDIVGTLLHELQHCRVMYSNKDKDVLALNPTNVYNKNKGGKLDEIYKDILYMMSEDELSAHLQSLYQYVLIHPEIDDIEIDDPKLYEIAGLKTFFAAYKNLYEYKQQAHDIFFVQELILNLAIILKELFKYKNPKLNKQYKDEILNGDRKYEGSIFQSMLDFIYSKIQEYQRKVARTIYFAIKDRDENNDIFSMDELLYADDN